MMLMTKAIKAKARKQYPRGPDMEQNVVAKFFDPCGKWTWYLMNQDPKDTNYLWGIVKGDAIETGSFALKDLTSYKGRWGLGIERDRYFRPQPAKEILELLNAGKHV